MKANLFLAIVLFLQCITANAGDYILRLHESFNTKNGKIPITVILSHDGSTFTKAAAINPYWFANYQDEFARLNYRATMRPFDVNTTGLTVSGSTISGTISMVFIHPERTALTRNCSYTINGSVSGNQISGTYSGLSNGISVNGKLSGQYTAVPLSINNSTIHLVLDNGYKGTSGDENAALNVLLKLQGTSLHNIKAYNGSPRLSIYNLTGNHAEISPIITEDGDLTYFANKTKDYHVVYDSLLTINGANISLDFQTTWTQDGGTNKGNFRYVVEAQVTGNHIIGTFDLYDTIGTKVKSDYCVGILSNNFTELSIPSLTPLVLGSGSGSTFTPPYFEQPDNISDRLLAGALYLYGDPMIQPFKSDYSAYAAMGTSDKQYDNVALNVFGAVRAYKLLSENSTNSDLAYKALKYAEKAGYYYMSRRWRTFKINEYYKGDFWFSFWTGWAMLDLKDLTGEQQWLDLAIAYAGVLSSTQQPNGTWTYVDEETGEIGKSNFRDNRSYDFTPLHCAEALLFLGRLRTEHGITTYQTVEHNAYAWMQANGENIETWKDRRLDGNPEGDGPVMYLRYLLQYAPSVNQSHLNNILSLVETNFVNWNHPASVGSFFPHVRSYWPRHNLEDNIMPSTAATSGMAWVYLKLFQNTGDTLYRNKGKELFYSVLATQDLTSGRIDHLGRQTANDHYYRIVNQDQHQYTALKSLTLGNLFDIYDLMVQLGLANPPATIKAKIDADKFTGLAPLIVNFDGSGSMGSNLTYAWIFGNGETSTQQQPSTTYNTSGNYIVSLTVTDTVQMISDITTKIIQVTDPPVFTSIDINPKDQDVYTGGTISYTAEAKDQYGNPMVPQPTFTWSVTGANSINSSGLFTAQNTPGGPFVVTAEATISGITHSGTTGVTVIAYTTTFSVTASADSTNGDAPLTVSFTANVSGINVFDGFIENGGMVVMEGENYSSANQNGDAVAWNIGGVLGGSGDEYVTTPSAANAYSFATAADVSYLMSINTPGTYTVWIRRYAEGGSYNSCFIGLNGSQLGGTIDNIQSGYNTWTWINAGSYSITAGERTFNLRRREPKYNVDKIVLTTNSSYNPTDLGPDESQRGVVVSYLWNFGDGDTSHRQNPVHTYNSEGTYYAIVTASDGSSMARDTLFIQVNIYTGKERAYISTNDNIINVYPSITNDKLHIKNNISNIATIVNNMGISTKTVIENGTLSLKDYPSGVYVVTIDDHCFKILKQ